MRSFLKIMTLFLLLLNGAGALYGGWHLMTVPDGSSLQMPLSVLQYSPFRDFFIPGMILFMVNGLFSFLVIVLMILNYRNYPWFVMAQGALLTGWIVIQVILVRGIHPLHLIFGTTGILLLAAGLLLKKRAPFYSPQ